MLLLWQPVIEMLLRVKVMEQSIPLLPYFPGSDVYKATELPLTVPNAMNCPSYSSDAKNNNK